MHDDNQILKGCLKKDRKYQKILLEKYSPFLLSVALRYHKNSQEANDVLQETWIKAFNNIQQYQEGSNLKAWLTKILINNALKLIQKNKNRQVISCENAMQIESKIISIEQDLAYKDLMLVVQKVKSPAKEIFMMYVIDGLSHKEIGEIMNIEQSTSRVHLTNARKALQRMLNPSNIAL